VKFKEIVETAFTSRKLRKIANLRVSSLKVLHLLEKKVVLVITITFLSRETFANYA
jgi:hypothetical protein